MKQIASKQSGMLGVCVCPICSTLEEEVITEVLNIVQVKEFSKNALIYQQQELCTGFYVITHGKVRIFKLAENGKQIVLNALGPGKSFGEAGLIGPAPQAENAVAIEKTKALFVPREPFLHIMEKHPSLSRNMIKSLSRWLGAWSQLIDDLHLSSASARVGRYLEKLVESQSSMQIELPEKKQDIAAQLGIRPETLSRILSQLEQQNVLRIDGRVLQVMDVDKLRVE